MDRNRIEQIVYQAKLNQWKEYDKQERAINWTIFPLWGTLLLLGQWNIDATVAGVGLSWRTFVVPVICLLAVFCSLILPMLVSFHGADESCGQEDHVGEGNAHRRKLSQILTRKLLPVIPGVAVFFFSAFLSPEGILGSFASLLVIVIAFVSAAASWLVLLLAYEFVTERAFGPALDPRDELIDSLSGILEEATRDDNSWHLDRGERQRLAKRIERAGARTRERFHLMAHPSQPAVRASIRVIAGKISSLLNRYATDVAIGGVDRDRLLGQRISDVLLLVSFGRWEDLTENEEHHPVKTILSRLLPRVIAGMSLLMVGVFSSSLFGSWAGPIVPQLRIALIAAAVLSVIDTPKSATERISDVFKR